MIDMQSKEYQLLTDYIHKNYGIKFSQKKKSLVAGRLQNILTQMKFSSFTDYYHYVISDTTGEAVTALIDKVTTNHTFFMREPEHFHFFRDEILPALVNIITDGDLRIWSAGCSTGEEPYTLAMIIQDFFGQDKGMWDTRILATDISTRVLDIAKKGEYRNEKINSLPLGWKINYFRRIDSQRSMVVDEIKDQVIFRRFNLMNPSFPFKKKFHVIFCRNVMIYFDDQTKKELLCKFYSFLEQGGYLFIGHSETIHRSETKFRYVMPAIYRKVYKG